MQCIAFYLTRGKQVEPPSGVNNRSAAQKLIDWYMPFMQTEGPKGLPIIPEEAFVVRQHERDLLCQRWETVIGLPYNEPG